MAAKSREDIILEGIGITKSTRPLHVRLFEQLWKNWQLSLFVMGVVVTLIAAGLANYHRLKLRIAPEERFEMILSAFNRAEYERVFYALEEFVDEYPNHDYAGKAKYLLAETRYLQIRQSGTATEADYNNVRGLFVESLGEDLTFFDKLMVRLRVAQCYHRMGWIKRAVADMEALFRHFPEHEAEIGLPLAQVYLDAGEYQKALAFVQDEYADAPDFKKTERLQVKGETLYQMGRLDEAEVVLDQLVSKISDAILERENRMRHVAREILDDRKKAVEEVEQAYDKAVTDYRALPLYRRLWTKSPERNAVKVFDPSDKIRGELHHYRVLEKDANFTAAHVYLLQARFDDALTALADARGVYPYHGRNIDSLFVEGNAYMKMAKHTRAIETFQMLEYKYPHTKEAHAARVRISDAYLAMGDMQKALGGAQENGALKLKSHQVGYVFSLPGVRGEIANNKWLDSKRLAKDLHRITEYFYRKDDLDRAILAITILLENVPATNEDYVLKAKLYEEKARRFLEEADKMLVVDAALREEKKMSAFRAYFDAGNTYMDLVKGKTTGLQFSDAMWFAAEAFDDARFIPGALQTIDRFITSSVGDQRMSWAKYRRGVYYQKLGLYQEAIQAFRSNAEQYSRNFYGHLSRYEEGMCYLYRDRRNADGYPDLDSAVRVFAAIIADRNIFPNSQIWKDSYFNLGEIFYRQGDYAQARRYLEKVLARYPLDARTGYSRFLLAKTLERIEDYPAACKQFAQAVREIEMSNNSDERLLEEAYMSLANCFFALKNYQEAMRYYQISADRFLRSKDAIWALFQIGNCYQGMGDVADASVAYARAKWMLDQRKKKGRESTPAYWRQMLDWLEQYAEWEVASGGRNT